MDAEGNVLTQPTGRSVQSFRKTHKALKEYEEIKKRMEAGEEGLDFKLFVAEWELGKLDWEQAKQRVEALGELTAEQSAKAKKILILAEIEHLAGNARDEAGLEKAAKRFKEILAAGNAPTKGGLGSTAWNFWYVLLNWADTQEDAALFAKASKKVKKILGDEERYADFFQRLDDRLTELQEKDPAKP